jgi:hypothetical protein
MGIYAIEDINVGDELFFHMVILLEKLVTFYNYLLEYLRFFDDLIFRFILRFPPAFST